MGYEKEHTRRGQHGQNEPQWTEGVGSESRQKVLWTVTSRCPVKKCKQSLPRLAPLKKDVRFREV